MEVRIPYGLRRYRLMVAVFGAFGAMLAWLAATVTEPSFVWPLGVLPPTTARIAYGCAAAAALAYIAAVSWVRFVRRPTVLLAPDRLEVPIGEFGTGTAAILHGSVRKHAVTTSAAGWRRLTVVHDGGVVAVQAAQLPDEGAFDAVVEHVRRLAG